MWKSVPDATPVDLVRAYLGKYGAKGALTCEAKQRPYACVGEHIQQEVHNNDGVYEYFEAASVDYLVQQENRYFTVHVAAIRTSRDAGVDVKIAVTDNTKKVSDKKSELETLQNAL